MSMAKLNVWITRFGDPCHIDDKEPYYVYITDCAGNILVWCGKKYAGLPAKCGHLEVDIPPGCYSVFASHSPQGHGIPPFGNRLTHVQVVRANCGDHVCVTLFAPSMWKCGSWFAYAVKTQLAGLPGRQSRCRTRQPRGRGSGRAPRQASPGSVRRERLEGG